jgi:hypothetical protein
MTNKPLVALLGNSLLIDGVAESLASRQTLNVIRIDSTDVGTSVKSLQPDLIVYELESPQSSAILALLSEQPGSLLLGLDLSSSRVIVMNSQQHITRSMQDLYQVFQTEAGLVANPPQGGGSTENYANTDVRHEIAS